MIQIAFFLSILLNLVLVYLNQNPQKGCELNKSLGNALLRK